MRILYLCHRIPYPPNKGDKVRAFHQIKALAAKHAVDVFTLADDAEDFAHRFELARYCRELTVSRVHPRIARLRAIPYFFSRAPMTLPYFHSPELERAVRGASRARTYDLIFVYCSAMAPYVADADGIPVYIDLVDVDSDKWMQYAQFSRFPLSTVYRREGLRLREYERRISKQAAGVVVSTEREAQLLRGIAGTAHVHAIPNGIDAEYFDPAAVPRQRTSPAIIFTGDMSYFPNREAVTYFAGSVLPLVRRSVGDARFLIVGRNPAADVMRMKQPGVIEVTGFVPDVRTYLAQAHVAVAPFHIAAGIQNKILEAMAYELPVVATPRAVQGLTPGVAELVQTGDSVEELAANVVQLLRDGPMAEELGKESRRRVTAEYNWNRSGDQLLDLLEGRVVPHAVESGLIVR
jgi:sugar transferase (PEP-CTERM/EpsH1 system associated)